MIQLFRNRDKGDYIQYMFIDQHQRVIEYPTFYINDLLTKTRYSSSSVYQFSNVLRLFCEALEKKYPEFTVDESLRVIEGNFIDAYLKKLSLNGLEYSTIRNRDAIIKTFMEWLTTEEAGRVREDSGYYEGKLKSPSPSHRLPKYITAKDVITFLSFLHEESQRCLFHFMFDTGLRISEVPRMKFRDLPDLSQSPIEQNYFKLLVPGSKGRGEQVKWRATIITRTMIERINRLHKNNKQYMKASIRLKKDMPMFLNVHGAPITKRAIADLINNTNKRSKMKISAHKFRHGFAMSILASEMDNKLTNLLVIIREALGHNDISTTQVYTTIAPQVVERIRDENERNEINFRYKEAQWIYKETFKPQKLHKEKRGRKSGKVK